MANAISVKRSYSGKTVRQTDMANAIRLMANAISVKRSYSGKKSPNGERQRHNGERHLAVMCINKILSAETVDARASKHITQQNSQIGEFPSKPQTFPISLKSPKSINNPTYIMNLLAYYRLIRFRPLTSLD